MVALRGVDNQGQFGVVGHCNAGRGYKGCAGFVVWRAGHAGAGCVACGVKLVVGVAPALQHFFFECAC